MYYRSSLVPEYQNISNSVILVFISICVGLISISFYGVNQGWQSVYGQKPDTVTINANLSEGNFQNATLSFNYGNSICPDIQCVMEFQDTSFNDLGQDRILSGTVKVEDKVNSNTNFRSFNYYKLSGNFQLVSSKENVITGERLLFYSGTLGIDKDDTALNPEFKFVSQIVMTQNHFQLTGEAEPSTEHSVKELDTCELYEMAIGRTVC